MTDHGGQPNSAGSHGDFVAAVLYDVDQLIRNGHVAQAASRAAELPRFEFDRLQPLLNHLSEDGYLEEVAVVELAWQQPILLQALRSAHRVGLIAAVVTLVAFFTSVSGFAVIPAMAARLLVSELYLEFVCRWVIESLRPEDRGRARILYDLSLYRTRGINRLGTLDATMLGIAGVALYAGSLWVRTTATNAWFVWVMVVSGTLMVAAGVYAIAATRRIARSGINAQGELQIHPLPAVVRPPIRQIERPVPFVLPRFGRSMLVPIFLFVVGYPTVTSSTQTGVIVGALCNAAGAWFLFRVMRSVLVISPSGVRDVGVFRTREWRWEEINEIRVVTERDMDRNQSLRLITSDGTNRALVINAGKRGADPGLLRLVDSMNHLACGSTSGPTRSARAVRLVGLAVMAVLIAFVGILMRLVVFDTSSLGIEASKVPAGRAVTYYRLADGSKSEPNIECPSLASHLSGGADPLCGDAVHDRVVVLSIMLFFELAFAVVAVLIARSYLRLIRERKAARVAT